MSDTPETNRLRGNYDEDPFLNDIWETMERIERERAIELERAAHYRDQWQTAMRERDEARENWGTESMNAAQFFGEKTKAIAERDEWRITASSLKAGEIELIKENTKLRDIAEMAVKLLTNPPALSVFPTLAIHNEEHGKQLRSELEQLKGAGYDPAQKEWIKYIKGK
jgi:hypothetical protein